MTGKRRPKEDPTKIVPTPDKQLEHSSGWCITGHHDNCKFSFDHGKCGCSCHVSPTRATRGRPRKEAIEQKTEGDPRPWMQKG